MNTQTYIPCTTKFGARNLDTRATIIAFLGGGDHAATAVILLEDGTLLERTLGSLTVIRVADLVPA